MIARSDNINIETASGWRLVTATEEKLLNLISNTMLVSEITCIFHYTSKKQELSLFNNFKWQLESLQGDMRRIVVLSTAERWNASKKKQYFSWLASSMSR